MDHQPEVPGKSVTDLLTQVILRVAGPEPRNPYSRQAPYDDGEADEPHADDEAEYEWVDAEDDTPADSAETADGNGEEVDDTGRGRRRDDKDLFRI